MKQSTKETTLDNKSEAISEFTRLVNINHEVDQDELIKNLSIAYDQGVELGKLKSMFGTDFHNLKSVKGFRLENFLRSLVSPLEIKRISSSKNLKYTGHDISESSVLVCDFTIKQSLAYMTEKNGKYGGFESQHRDIKWYNEERNTTDKEEKEYIEFAYHKQEVYVLVQKIYQLGFADGEKLSERISSDIFHIFKKTKEISNYKNGIDDSKFVEYGGRQLRIAGIVDDTDLEKETQFLDYLKTRNPTWEQYREVIESHLYYY